MGNITDNNDKLIGVPKVSEETWDNKCRYCQSTKICLTPVGIDFVYTEVANTDMLPKEIARYYKYVPNVVDAVCGIIDGQIGGARIMVSCDDCKNVSTGFYNANGSQAIPVKSVVKKQLIKYYNLDVGSFIV